MLPRDKHQRLVLIHSKIVAVSFSPKYDSLEDVTSKVSSF